MYLRYHYFQKSIQVAPIKPIFTDSCLKFLGGFKILPKRQHNFLHLIVQPAQLFLVMGLTDSTPITSVTVPPRFQMAVSITFKSLSLNAPSSENCDPQVPTELQIPSPITFGHITLFFFIAWISMFCYIYSLSCQLVCFLL